MPTTRPRHSITETEPVQAALDALRTVQGSVRVDLAELVILGAREKTRLMRQQSPAARRARSRLADRIDSGNVLVDVDAADRAKHAGLIA